MGVGVPARKLVPNRKVAQSAALLGVDAGGSSAKFWLNPVSLHYNIGFSARELRVIERIVLDHRQQFVEAWDAYFGT
ncbi:MAG TPA: DUF4160 domain-containing protein [Thermoanaerobaculia bacterium]|nr:DUF4160 domain-containing protein [Thermoanaerobaculia bacterium]